MRGPYIPLFSGWWIFEREFSRAENVEIGHTISSLLLAESILLTIGIWSDGVVVDCALCWGVGFVENENFGGGED